MKDKNKEIEIASAERIKYFVNMFYYYLKAKNFDFQINSKSDILELFKKTNDFAHINKPQEHEKVKSLLDGVQDPNSKSYSQLSTELKLSSKEERPISILEENFFREMQEKYTEFAAEYTRSIF